MGCNAGPAGRLFLPKRLPIHNPIHPTEDHHETIAFSSDYFCSCFCCVYLSGVEGPPSPAFRIPPEPEQPDPTLEARTFVLAFLFCGMCRKGPPAGTRTLLVAAFGMETQEVRVTVVANERTSLKVRLVDDGATCRNPPLPSLPLTDPDTMGTISIFSRQDMTGY